MIVDEFLAGLVDLVFFVAAKLTTCPWLWPGIRIFAPG
jgi:hypothetical protein